MGAVALIAGQATTRCETHYLHRYPTVFPPVLVRSVAAVLASPSRALRGLSMALRKAREFIGRDAVEPQPNGLPVSSQMCCNLRMTESLFRKLKGQGQLCECLHVHRLLWTVEYLRQHCGDCPLDPTSFHNPHRRECPTRPRIQEVDLALVPLGFSCGRGVGLALPGGHRVGIALVRAPRSYLETHRQGTSKFLQPDQNCSASNTQKSYGDISGSYI